MKENWKTIYSKHDVDYIFSEFQNSLNYYLDVALPLKRIKINQSKNKKSKWVTKGIRISGKTLRFLSSLTKGKSVSQNFIQYVKTYKKVYNKVIKAAKQAYNDKH